MPVLNLRIEDKFNLKCPRCNQEGRIHYEVTQFGTVNVYCKGCGDHLLNKNIDDMIVLYLKERYGDDITR
jgi:uncharacterized protein (DUF983 family)